MDLLPESCFVVEPGATPIVVQVMASPTEETLEAEVETGVDSKESTVITVSHEETEVEDLSTIHLTLALLGGKKKKKRK